MTTNIKSILGDYVNAYDDYNSTYWEQVRTANTLTEGLALHEQYEEYMDRLQTEFANKILEVYINTLKQL